METNDFKTYSSVPSTAIRTWEDFQRLIPKEPETVVSYNDVRTIKSEILRLMLLVPVECRAKNIRRSEMGDSSHWLFRIFGRENANKYKHLFYDKFHISMSVFQEWPIMTADKISAFEDGFKRLHQDWPSDKCSLFDFMCVVLFYNQLPNNEARQRAPRFNMPVYKNFFCFKDWSLHEWTAFSRERFPQGRGLPKKKEEDTASSSETPAAAHTPSVAAVTKEIKSRRELRPKLSRAGEPDVSQAKSAKSSITLYYPDGNVYIDISDPMSFLNEFVMIDVFRECETFNVTMETVHDHFSFIKFPSPVTLTWKNCVFFGTPARDFEISELLLIMKGKMEREFVSCSWEDCIKKLFFDHSSLVKNYFDWVDQSKPNLVYVDTFVMVDRDDPDRFLLNNMKKDDICDLSKHIQVMDRFGRRFPSVTREDGSKAADTSEPEEMPEYERQRLKRIEENKGLFRELGMTQDREIMEESSRESGRSHETKRSKRTNEADTVSTRCLRSDITTLRPNDPFRNCLLTAEQHASMMSLLDQHRKNPLIQLVPAAASASVAAVEEAAGGESKKSTGSTVSKTAPVSETLLDDSFEIGEWSLSDSPVHDSILAGDGDERALGLGAPFSSDPLVSPLATSITQPSASSAQLTDPLAIQPSESAPPAPAVEKIVVEAQQSGLVEQSASQANVEQCSGSQDKQSVELSSMENKPEASGSAQSGQDESVSKRSVESSSAAVNDERVLTGSSVETGSSAIVMVEKQSEDPKQEVAQVEGSAHSSQVVAQVEGNADPSQEVVAGDPDQMQIDSGAVVVPPDALPTGDFPLLLQSINIALLNAFKTQETKASTVQARCQQQQDVLQDVSRNLTEVCSDIRWVLNEVQTLQGSDSSQLVLSQLEQSVAQKRLAMAALEQQHASTTAELNVLREKIKEKKQQDSRLDLKKEMLDLADQRKQLEFENEKQALETTLRAEFLVKEKALRAEFAEKERVMRAEFEEKEKAMRAQFQAQNADLENKLSAKDLELSAKMKRCEILEKLNNVNEGLINRLKARSAAASEVSCTTGAASGGSAVAKRNDSTSSEST